MWRSIVIVFGIFAAAQCAKILAVIPTPSISHQVVFRPITQELAKRGHEVVVITTDPEFPKGQAPKNLREIDLHDFSYELWKEKFLVTSSTSDNNLYTQLDVSQNLIRDLFIQQIKTNEVQEIIKNETFDLLLLEAFVRPPLIFSHLYKVPVIQISSFGGFFGNYETVGAPVHPLLYPLSSRQRINNLTLWEKITELYNFFRFHKLISSLEKLEVEALREAFGHDVPSLSELKKNVDMLFLNVHPIWEENRPVPPSVVYMGGVHEKAQNDLSKEWESYLNSSKNGVVYVSFGTNVNPSLLPPEKIQAMVDAFSQLPYDFLWKWDKDVLPGKTANIKISKWLPQSDLLRHPKIKLFVTQAGLQSTDEAVVAGVPLVGIPLLGDQWFNAEKYVQQKLGLKLDMETLNSKKLKETIETVINDKSYRQNVVKFRTLMYDQKEKPLDRVIWWTEHILRHGGGSHLRAPTANMPWSEFLVLDVVLALLAGALTVLSLAGFILFSVYKNVFKSSGKLKKN